MNNKEIMEFYRLVVASLEGDLSDAEYEKMLRMIEQSDEIAYFYSELIKIHTNLTCPKLADTIFNNSESDVARAYSELINGSSDTWMALLDIENHAPVIAESGAGSLDQKLEGDQPIPLKIRYLLYTFALGAVAMIIVAVGLQMHNFDRIRYNTDFKPIHYEVVATLVDDVDAVFEDIVITKESSYRFSTNSLPVKLLDGVARIKYDNGVNVYVEGPSSISFVSATECYLHYGSIYAIVPESGYGFTVVTEKNRIVDLGTEFGVIADYKGNTEMHVIKGKTSVSGQDIKGSKVFTEGQACRASSTGDQLRSVALKEHSFVRAISSETGFIWRGEPLKLASMLSGGNGFDNPDNSMGIDPATGQARAEIVQEFERKGDDKYHSVPGRKFIDGVFVPNGANVMPVTSEGHVFRGFPVTDGYYWGDVTANPSIKTFIDGVPGSVMIESEVAGMKFNGSSDNSLVLVQSNSGITFDLEIIRKEYPSFDITRFSTICGMTTRMVNNNRAEMWILLDGVCVFHYEINKDNREAKDFKLDLKPGDRFLTFAVTDGADKIGFDWCAFAQPHLTVVPKQ
ncbi:MAG: NPCBM/NEW2 domain-containing protein [Sedimentisphaerales bacterium]|nr:NPCBM/NEW2 domain-containing protein [Sedimentisphaerales bacterium]